jgi:nucleotide-binding universal stress UspA family protein
MKTILALTDFSPNSESAAAMALSFARKLNAEVLLYNAFYVYVGTEVPMEGGIFPYYNDISSLETESASHLKALEKKLLDSMLPGTQPTVIRTINAPGTLTENIQNILKEHSIEIIVMGNKTSTSFFDRFFIGSDTDAVISSTYCPVIMMPEKGQIKPVKKIAFASDFAGTELTAITYLTQFAKELDAEIVCVHAFEKPDKQLEESGYKFYQKLQSELNFSNLSYKALHANKAGNGLEQFANHEEIDLLALTKRNHSIFQTLFKKSVLKEVISSHHVPLMIFPEAFRSIEHTNG